MIDAPDTVLHKLTTCYNSIPRTDVREAVRRTGDINQRLSTKSIIVEPESSRNDIEKEVFDKLTSIESVRIISMVSKYLGNKSLQLTSRLQEAKNYYDEAIKTNTNDEIVSDMIK